ncbi:inter-alpha-trypsin inhibitor heavy chain H5-like [Nematolebias whitei]|uniref:inter-alpha-trypsin inhibitor heavy chain H5-like n=1 Tax=Nematolebias whitei TaxID=451745 RepID=UPI00189B611F|nr:inter-alpha-trypsin inhibitor heavy chain H5-like [Nematolebias whitei]
MLLLTLLLCFSPAALGQLAESQFEDDVDPDQADFDLDFARRVPRQLKPVKEAKSHIQELSIKTTIISRYAFTAVHCAMLNRYSAAAEGLFQFQIPAGAYISNFTM